MKRLRSRWLAVLGGVAIAVSGLAVTSITAAQSSSSPPTATPIQHLVVLFDENISFDHYFGTYPHATNPTGEPSFAARPHTPAVNNLVNQVTPSGPTGPLLTNNGNLSNPLRIDRADPLTCDQGHGYTAEQSAADHGAEDMYAQDTGNNQSLTQCLSGFPPVRARTRPSWTTTTATPSRRCGTTPSTSP